MTGLRVVVVFRLFLFPLSKGWKQTELLSEMWPSCCVTLCLFVSVALSILKTFCFYASSGGKLSQFSQKPSYSHLSSEERAILGISIYISLKITDFCVVRRNAGSRRARTQQVFHKNELCNLKGFHTYCILTQPESHSFLMSRQYEN